MPSKKKPTDSAADPTKLDSSIEGDHTYRVVIETPRGSRNKYSFKPEMGAYALRKVLPAGMTFPYDFGFVPSTEAEDGDPIDVLVLMDEPTFAGCAVDVRLIGVMKFEEVEKGDRHRNDRLIGVATISNEYGQFKTLDELGDRHVDDIEKFLSGYQHLGGKEFKVLGRGGPEEADKLVRDAQRRAEKKKAA